MAVTPRIPTSYAILNQFYLPPIITLHKNLSSEANYRSDSYWYLTFGGTSRFT
jgi:hypothetical protein